MCSFFPLNIVNQSDIESLQWIVVGYKGKIRYPMVCPLALDVLTSDLGLTTVHLQQTRALAWFCSGEQFKD